MGGSIAVAILSKLGFNVVAGTGKKESHSFLQNLGAKKIVSREELSDASSFILRAASLSGVDSAEYPMKTRKELCGRLAEEWKPEGLSHLMTKCNLEELNDIYIDKILKGNIKGRVVVAL